MLRAVLLVLTLVLPVGAAAQDLQRALRLDELMHIMAEEGRADGRALREEMLPDASADRWDRTLARIYDPDRMEALFLPAFKADLARSGGDIAAMTAFLDGPVGRKTTEGEIKARTALLDPAVEDRARLVAEELRTRRDPRINAVEDFADANGLVEMNVAGGLNATLAFFAGLRQAGALDVPEDEMLRNVWAQEPVIRQETEVWLWPYLVMSLRDLDAAELEAYTRFSATRDGQALNAALFAGFDAVLRDMSHRLGIAVGRQIRGRDI